FSSSPFRAPQRDCAGAPLPTHVCSARTPEGGRAIATDNADELVPFQDVRVIRSTAPALLCRVGEKSVWLPREHIRGKLWCVGDRGQLFIRRWVARDRQLIELVGAMIGSPVAARSLSRLPGQLRLLRRNRNTRHAT